MSVKSFELFSVELQNDIALFKAVHYDKQGEKKVQFTYEQSKMFATVRKRNTLLFEQMNEITHKNYYAQAGDTVTDLLYEVIIVNFKWKKRGDTPYYIENTNENAKVEILDEKNLRELVYRDGFTITGIPGESGEVVYKPFVSSASMAREEKYLFVRQDRIKDLMESLSLGLVSYNNDNHFVIQGLREESEKQAKLSVAKLSAYLGLMLSDGTSIKELKDEFTHKYGQKSDTANLIDFELNAESVVCVPSYDAFELPLDILGPYVWKSTRWDTEDKYDCPKLSGSISDTGKANALSEFFNALSDAVKQDIKPIVTDQQDDADKQNGRQNFRNFISGKQGKLAIDAWKELLQNCLYEDMQKLVGSGLPIPDLSQPLGADSNNALCYRAYTLALALNYKRANQTRYIESKRKLGYKASGFTPRTDDDFSRISVDKDALGQRINLFYAAIDELNVNRYGNIAVNTLIDIAKKWKNYYLEIALENATDSDDASADGSKEFLRFKLSTTSDLMGAKLVEPTEEDKKAELYDGIGFCDNEYFDKIERLLLCKTEPETPRRYNGLIIRLPFIKGLLLRMDFLEYFVGRNKIPSGSETTAKIKDVFDIERYLYNDDGTPKVHVMLTRSMFKIYQQWKLLEKKPEDAWKEYWERIGVNGFELLITQRNTPPKKTSRLNYQFLSTLGLEEKEINNLVERTIGNIAHGIDDPSSLLKDEEAPVISEDETCVDPYPQDIDEADGSGASCADKSKENGDNESGNGKNTVNENGDDEVDFETIAGEVTDSVLLAACEKNKKLYNCRYIKNMVHDRIWGSLIDAMYGRLEVDGDVRLLVPDLMATLDYIGDKCVSYKGKTGKETPKVVSHINGVGKGTSSSKEGHGYYYAPGDDAPWKTNIGHKKVCVLRNPHFAVGEDALLEPLDNKMWAEYDKWFEHLTGTVFLPGSAFLTINGADSDGDIGNVCCEYSVVKAVKRTAKNNVKMLKEILNRRDKIIEKLKSEKNKSAALLLSWFKNSTPPSQKVKFKAGYCPTIIYAGSGSIAAKERPSDLNVTEEALSPMTHLEKRFWEVFTLTAEAAIGLKSIQALSLAGVAYPCASADDYKPMDDMELLGKWLSHYRVVNCGLDTANAIDSAKTNRRYKTLPIGQTDPDVDRIVNLLKDGTSFKDFRTKSKRKLKDRKVQRNKNYKEVFNEILENVHETQKDSAFVLDWLPSRLFEHSQKDLPSVQRYPRWKSDESIIELADAMKESDSKEQTDGEPTVDETIEKALITLVNAYLSGIKSRNRARTQRDTLREHYERIVRLLIYTYPLTEVSEKMELLLGDGTYSNSFIGKYYKKDEQHDQLKNIQKTLRDEELLSQIAWSSPKSRKYLLEKKVFDSEVKSGDKKYNMVMAMLTDTEQGVYLLKSIVRYLLEATDMSQTDAQTETVARTPKGLRRQMEEEIKKYQPDAKPYEVTRILCNNCISMVKNGSLSDFLFIELMGEELPKYVSNGGAKA